jgi:predicted amidohydrolase YtcJ
MEGTMLRRRVSRRSFVGTAAGVAAGAALAPPLLTTVLANSQPTVPNCPAELILTNANVITMNPAQPAAEAVAIARGRILMVGTNQDIVQSAGPVTEMRDLGAQALIPGLYDSHNHMLRTGLNLSAVDLSEARSIADVLAAIGSRAASTPSGEWVASSSRWHESQLAEQRFPRREELDGVAPNNPVLIRRGGHNVVLNSLAFEMAGIGSETPDPPGGTYVRDPESGELTGHVIGAPAFARVLRLLPPTTRQDRLDALRAVLQLYREVGLTSVIEPGLTPEEMEALRELADSGELTTRTSMMWSIDPGTTEESLQAALEILASGAVSRNLDDPWLRTIAIKLVADGGVETGFHREPYAYADDPSSPRGKPRISPENLVTFCTEAARQGWQVGTHCVGDAAIDQVLSAYRAVNGAIPIVDKRWTLVHMMAARPDHWDLVNELRLAITAQQLLMYSLAAGFLKYLGPDRARNIEPMRLYLTGSRQPIGGGSDSPVTPYDPMIGIWSSVTRTTELAGVQGPEWSISAEEALQTYTLGSAWCAFEEDVKGSIEPGKYADLVALSADPRAVEPDTIKDIQTMLTIVDGRVVFDRAQGTTGQSARPLRVTASVDDGCACAHA